MDMTRRERLLASLQGRPVDRPAVSFYEIGGFAIDADNADPFNIYNDPSWRPVLQLAEEKTDLIRLRHPRGTVRHPELRKEFFHNESWLDGETRWGRVRIRVGGRELTELRRRDAAVATWWTVEHLIKSEEDVRAYLQLPDEAMEQDYDCSGILQEDRALGDRGLVMIDVADPMCLAASSMSMEDYSVLALTNPPLFHTLLEKHARQLHRLAETVSARCPGFLWRIVGPEYATEPYLPPRLFEEYVVRYTGPMISVIRKSGGYARIHCHGRIKSALAYIVQMGADAIDPIEPPPQGNVNLIDVRREYGRQLTLFGNIEASDIENLEESRFERVVAQTLRDGTAGEGRGFVLLPSGAPYGRTITPRTMANYETMVRLARGFRA